MKIAFLLLFVAGTAAADTTIMDNNKTITIDCAKDKDLSLLGNHLVITLSNGACNKISITGNHETVTGAAKDFEIAGNFNTINPVDAAIINVMGNNNTVAWKSAKGAPKISNVGKSNSVTQSK
ncbi:MAG TPA: DUF3060 domain-containing protein [Kofleriaceae bacterium]|jgi:hypothetical protein